MDVGIDEAGGDQRVAVLEDLDVADLAEQGFGVTEASDLPSSTSNRPSSKYS